MQTATGLLHRELMERALGRKLSSNECVHHKNGDRRDNRLSNLEVMDRAAHTLEHHPALYPRTRECLWCCVQFEVSHGNRNVRLCCSKSCGLSLRWAIRRGERPTPMKPNGIPWKTKT